MSLKVKPALCNSSIALKIASGLPFLGLEDFLGRLFTGLLSILVSGFLLPINTGFYKDKAL